jgi:hypothetical protein
MHGETSGDVALRQGMACFIKTLNNLPPFFAAGRNNVDLSAISGLS